MHVVALPDDPIGPGKGGVEVVALAIMGDAERDVRPQMCMDRGGVRLRCCQRIEERGQGSVVHLDAVHGIPRHRALPGHHDRDGLPDITYLAFGQHGLLRGTHLLHLPLPCHRSGGNIWQHMRNVVTGEDRQHIG